MLPSTPLVPACCISVCLSTNSLASSVTTCWCGRPLAVDRVVPQPVASTSSRTGARRAASWVIYPPSPSLGPTHPLASRVCACVEFPPVRDTAMVCVLCGTQRSPLCACSRECRAACRSPSGRRRESHSRRRRVVIVRRCPCGGLAALSFVQGSYMCPFNVSARTAQLVAVP